MTDESLRINYVTKIIDEAKLVENPLEHLKLVRDIMKNTIVSDKYCENLKEVSKFLLNDYESVRITVIGIIMESKIKSNFIINNLKLSSKKSPVYFIYNEPGPYFSPRYDRNALIVVENYSKFKNVCD